MPTKAHARPLALLVSVWALVACGTEGAGPTAPGELTAETSGAGPSRLLDQGNAVFVLGNANLLATSGNSLGLVTAPPGVRGDMNVVVGAAADTNAVVRYPAGGLVVLPAGLDATATLRLPRASAVAYGVNVARKNKAHTRIDANVRLSAADLDPTDARFRLRVVAAPVLNPNGGHTPQQQGYTFVGLRNIDRAGLALAGVGTYAGQPGLPWQDNGAYSYTPWQVLELVSHVDEAAVGERLQLSFAAAGCSLGGHYGALYVDEVGHHDVGGLTLVAYGPDIVPANAQLSYALRLHRSAEEGPSSNPNGLQVYVAVPAGTSFVALTAPSGWHCITPPQQANGIVCTVANIAAGEQQVATLTLQAGAASSNAVVLADYGVRTPAFGTLLGPARPLQVVATASALADVQIETAEQLELATATNATVRVRVHNAGPQGAPGVALVDAAGSHLAPLSWSCVAQGNAATASSSANAGSGRLTTAWDLAAGANVVCTVLLARDGSGTQDTYGVRARVPAGVTDTASFNDEGATFVRGTYQPPAVVPDHVDEPSPEPTPGKDALGTPCTTAAGCASGLCVDGVCCNAPCAGTCEACDLAGTAGYCTPVDHAPPSPGHGSCGPFACVGGRCATACDDDDACHAGLQCQHKICRPIAGRCAADDDCGAGESCTVARTCESLSLQVADKPGWKLEGSGCAAGPGGGPGLGATLALGALALVRRRRRLAGSHLLGALFFAAATLGYVAQALAAEGTSLPTNGFLPLGGLQDVYGAAASPSAASGSFSVGAWFNYARSPLRLRHLVDPPARQDVVKHQLTLDLVGGVALPGHSEIDVAVPGVLQENRRASFYDAGLTRQHWQGSLGDVRLTPKWSYYVARRVRLGVLATVGLPTGRRGSFVGRGGLSVTPALLGEVGPVHGPRLLANVGVTLQGRRVIADLDDRLALRWQLAGELPLAPWLHLPLAARAAAFGQMDLQRPRIATAPIEALGGLAWLLPAAWSVDVAAGGGLDRGLGAPRWRVLAAVRWQPERTEPQVLQVPVPPPADAPELVPAPDASSTNLGDAFATPIVAALDPNGDEDGDGVRNACDRCPTVAGDANGPTPGCPSQSGAAELVHTFRLVHFPRGTAELKGGDDAALEQVREVLLALPLAHLEVAGHTDDTSSKAVNLRLSRARAEAARAWLLARGIAPDRVRAVGYGDKRPLDRRPTAAARARNRRVVFTLLPLAAAATPSGTAAKGAAPSAAAPLVDERGEGQGDNQPEGTGDDG